MIVAPRFGLAARLALLVTLGAPVMAAETPPQGAGDTVAPINAFNRLLTPTFYNLPPSQDGIHDPTNFETFLLMTPREAFANLVSAKVGNRVDWVKSLAEKRISPRYERSDPGAQPYVFDLNIVRVVKGTMPDVVYPHKQHTEWLDCSNCHPAIFWPQKGSNQISMAAILMGQKCGICHGTVAFPPSECRLCHSKKKGRGGEELPDPGIRPR